MLRWLGALLSALVMTGFAFLLLSGDYIREGPVLVTLSTNHGIHRGDVGVVSFWVLGMIGLATSLTSGRTWSGSRH